MDKIIRSLHPNYLSLRMFFSGWSLFLCEETYNLIIIYVTLHVAQRYFLFSALRLWLYWAMAVAARRFMAGGICSNEARLNGHIIIITGADSGIGKQTAKELTLRGAHLVLACRDVKKGERTKQELMALKGSVEVRHCDLSSLKSVREFAEGIIRHKYTVHMLINHAGEMMCPYSETEDGLEHQMAVNHLGHFLLTNMLLPRLTHSKPARIINVSTTAHIDGEIPFGNFNYKKKGYNKWQAYCNSKLATVLFTRHLAKKLKGTNISVYCANPGVSQSALYRHVLPEFVYRFPLRLLLKTAREAAQTATYCATEATQHDACYYSECSAGWPSAAALDDEIAEKLWRESEKLVGLAP